MSMAMVFPFQRPAEQSGPSVMRKPRGQPAHAAAIGNAHRAGTIGGPPRGDWKQKPIFSHVRPAADRTWAPAIAAEPPMSANGKPAMNGPTPFFFEDETIDRLLGMVMALGAEISKVDEKLDTVLRLLDQQQVLPAADVVAFVPDAEQQAQRNAVRKAFVESLLAPFQMEADALVARAAQPKG
jgi:hypothetical protein